MIKFALPLALMSTISTSFASLSVANENLNQCMKDICGPVKNNPSYEYYRDAYQGSGLSEAQKERIKEVIASTKSSEVAKYKEAKQLVDSFSAETYKSFLKVDQGLVAFIHLVLPAYGEVLMAGYSNRVDPSNFDEAKLIELLKTSGKDEKEAQLKARAFLLAQSSNSASKIIGLLYSQNPEYHLGLLLGQLADKPILRIYHDLFGPLMASYEERLPGAESSLIRSLAINSKSYLSLGELSAEEIRTLNTLFAMILLETQYNREKNGEEKDGLWTFLLSDEAQESASSAVLKRVGSIKTPELSEEAINSLLNQSSAQCVAGLDQKAKKFPTKEEHKRFRDFYRGLVQKAKRFTNKEISYSMGRRVEEELGRVQIDLPPTLETYLDELSERIVVAQNTEITNELIAINSLSEPSGIAPFQKSVDLCQEDALDIPFYDHSTAADYIMPTLKISWTTIRELERFRGVVAHEVGHRLYEMFKGESDIQTSFTQDEFDRSTDIFQCISNNYPAKEETRITYAPSGEESSMQVSKYANEDFADQFAAWVDRDNEHNFACVFLSGEDDEYAGLSFLNPIEEDHHSAGAFRVLNVEKTKKGFLPQSCEVALRESNQELNICI